MNKMTVTPETTLEQSKQFLRDHLKEGAICPCCKQHVKMYERKLSATMAHILILIDKRTRQTGSSDFFHVSKFLDGLGVGTSERADWQKLTHFDLIQKSEKIRTDGSSRVGMYRITSKGRSFARGEENVPKSCFIYNGKVYGLAKEHVTIKQALTERFNYDDLMS
jgi:hypothetical protein